MNESGASAEGASNESAAVHSRTWGDIGEGLIGALIMGLNLVTPFLRGPRSHWGLTRGEAARVFVGDDYVDQPRWSWAHAIDIDASAEEVWSWVAQIGQGKAGFYSYQWLENLAGCRIENADRVHPEWGTLQVGDAFRLHPTAPPLIISRLEPGRFLFASTEPLAASGAGEPEKSAAAWVRVGWLLAVEPLGATRSRFVSRYRVSYGGGWLYSLGYGPWLMEPITFAMDRRMLKGVKERAEKARHGVPKTGARLRRWEEA